MLFIATAKAAKLRVKEGQVKFADFGRADSFAQRSELGSDRNLPLENSGAAERGSSNEAQKLSPEGFQICL